MISIRTSFIFNFANDLPGRIKYVTFFTDDISLFSKVHDTDIPAIHRKY